MTGFELWWYNFKDKLSLLIMLSWLILLFSGMLYGIFIGITEGFSKKENIHKNCICLETETEYDSMGGQTYCIKYHHYH